MKLRLCGVLLAISMVLFGCSDKTRGKKGSDSAEPTDSVPVPAVLTPEGAIKATPIDLGSRPLSFAPLIQQADQSVALIKTVGTDRRGRRVEGLGTGFVYDPEGFLITNHHVIDNASQITVTLTDGRVVPAKIVGSDQKTDIAVIQVDLKGLPALPLGNSDQILVGDWVVAIGNPFGLKHTASIGILSAKGRTRDDVADLDKEGYFDFLQTDASINPGNSGGPLLNIKGEVVGINSAIRANAEGIGFAIPINMVRQLLPTLLKYGKVRRSAIGVVVDALTIEQASRLGLKSPKGAWVKGVQGDGPADKAGIAVDDVIIGFNGNAINDENNLRWYASIGGVGQVATLKISRGGKEMEVKVTLTELPGQDPR